MNTLNEFRTLAVKGNAIDMTVGIIIGGAFGKIVGSSVNDVVMPPIGQLLGGVNFSGPFISLSGGDCASLELAKDAAPAAPPKPSEEALLPGEIRDGLKR